MSSHEKALVTMHDVSVVYEKRSIFGNKITPVLTNLDLEIHQGETLGVIGRNGAGKSTLLKLICQVLRPSSGVIDIAPDIKATLLTYQLGFSPHISGRKNAIYSGMLYGLEKKQIEQYLPDIFSFAGLEKHIDKPVSSYSAGMRARLGFSVALWADPEIILIDEALGVGDHEFRQKSGEAIKQWIKTDKTVVFVSHDEQSVRALCDRVLWLEHGQAVFQGDTNNGIDLYLSYDHWVHSMVKNNPGWTEDYIRSHPLNRNPAQVLKKMRGQLKDSWSDVRSQTLEKYNGVVQSYFPSPKNSPTFHIVRCEDEQSIWVENTRIILQGEHTKLMAIKKSFDDLIQTYAARSNTTVADFRKEKMYALQLDLICNAGKTTA